MTGYGRSFLRALAVVLSGVAAAGCTPNALVALPSTSARWIDDLAAAATNARVTVAARTGGWAEPARLELGGRATPVLVRVDNHGRVPLRISRTAFALVTGTTRFETLPPEVARPPSDVRGLPATTLAPGASVAGFLFFEPVVGDWGFVHLRTTLVDAASEALVGTVDVPFASGMIVRCTLRAIDRTEPRPEDWLFRTCLF